ncbi:hypothetical protein AU196_02775 [Mycobacterium sp. IS-1742]|nr:hypothetical protein AU196_02775 [Mycobacterium sp. IS-1742]
MTLHNPAAGWTRLPYHMYKLTSEFRQKQLWKPQFDTRNPNGTTVKRWEVQGGTCVEMRGTRSWFGQCKCGCWIYSERDVSTPEFRGRGNRGPKGPWPKYCAGCRERRRQESIERRREAKRKSDRERIADKRFTDREEAKFNADRAPSDRGCSEADDHAKWAEEDREAALRYQQRRGVRSPYDRV